MLDLPAADGSWGGGALFPAWGSTAWTLVEVMRMGLDPARPQAGARPPWCATTCAASMPASRSSPARSSRASMPGSSRWGRTSIGTSRCRPSSSDGRASRWSTAAGTASRRTARRAARSTARSRCSRACSRTSAPSKTCRPARQRGGATNTRWSADSCAAAAPGSSSTPPGRVCPIRRGTYTTCCAACTTGAMPAALRTRGRRRGSGSSVRSAAGTGAGRWSRRIRAGSASTWTRARGGPAAGARCGRCASWRGTAPAARPARAAARTRPARAGAGAGARRPYSITSPPFGPSVWPT